MHILQPHVHSVCRMCILQNAHLFAECAYCRMHMSLMDTFFIYFLFRRELFVFVSFVWIRWENNGALVWGAWGWQSKKSKKIKKWNTCKISIFCRTFDEFHWPKWPIELPIKYGKISIFCKGKTGICRTPKNQHYFAVVRQTSPRKYYPI